MNGLELVKLIDLSRCTACRGCQIACKQWNNLPASQTNNFGSYQNPPDREWNTWTLIRFNEIEGQNGKVKWLFRKDGCMHCTDAACVKVCPTQALFYTEFGAVDIDYARCIGCKECITACPFHVPRYDKATNKIYKCNLCYSRLRANQPPACVQSCPTGALQIGARDEMVRKAYQRAEELGNGATVYGDKFVEGTHVVYVLPEAVTVYDNLPEKPEIPAAILVWKDVLKPAGLIAAGAVAGAAFLHYVTHGPKVPTEENNNEKGEI
ncbi:MAG: 4Fe-4S dicluster domain-containing protein [Desulfobulbaceae bacterium]|nr:4Fe-4S dicluster domain-containing protein [Desulfobulbaceae bacterium]